MFHSQDICGRQFFINLIWHGCEGRKRKPDLGDQKGPHLLVAQKAGGAGISLEVVLCEPSITGNARLPMLPAIRTTDKRVPISLLGQRTPLPTNKEYGKPID